MYHRVGQKIMGIAAALTTVGIIISFLLGLVFMFVFAFAEKPALGFVLFIATIALGTLLSWLSSVLLYGFGRLVDNSDRLVSMVDDMQKESTTAETIGDALKKIWREQQ